MPPRLRLLTDIGGTILAAVMTTYIARYPADLSWPIAMLIGLAGAAVFLAWRTVPKYVYTGVVIALWLITIPLVTWLFAAVTPEFGLDYEGRLAGLALYGVLLALLAHRTSVGRPFLTVAFALTAVTVTAAVSYYFAWAAGVWIAYAAGLIIVALRSGVGGWLRDTLDQTVEWWSTRKHPRADLARWNTQGVEVATAGTLGRLDPTYRVIHDRVIPGSVDDAVTIDHIVIGAPGITVVASVRLGAGPISQRPDGSLWQQGRSLDRLLRESWWQARVVQSRIDLPTSAILAVHSPTPFDEPLQVGMFEHQGDGNEELTGTVTLLHADTDNGQQLLDAITGIAVIDPYTAGQVRRYARRIIRSFPAGQLTEPTRWKDRAKVAELWPADAQPIAVDSDGHVPHNAVAPPTADGPHEQRAAIDQQPSVGDDVPDAALPTMEAAVVDDERPAEHQEYQWDGGEEADEQARESLEVVAMNTLKPGDKVNALRSSGMLIGWVVVSDAYIHANGRPVIDIAESDAYAAAQRSGDHPAHYIAESIDHLTVVEA